MIHYDDLIQLIQDSGLDAQDVADWLEQRQLCGPALDRYMEGACDIAEATAPNVGYALRGIFWTGLTLGCAITEHQSDQQLLEALVRSFRGWPTSTRRLCEDLDPTGALIRRVVEADLKRAGGGG